MSIRRLPTHRYGAFLCMFLLALFSLQAKGPNTVAATHGTVVTVVYASTDVGPLTTSPHGH